MTVDREMGATIDPLRLPLTQIVSGARTRALDRLECYYRSTQYESLAYDWDGQRVGVGAFADIEPGWLVPLKMRRPSAKIHLAASMVQRFTSMLFGRDRWPELHVVGDQDAEDLGKELQRISGLATKMIEARNLGGACGTAALSFAFVAGRPRVQVHNAKHCTVLEWETEEDMRPAAAIEAYVYKRSVVEDGKIKERDYVYARLWTREYEQVWEPIPKTVADRPFWSTAVPSRRVEHGLGFCPFYWIQNIPDSYNVDGESDFAGLCDELDEINQLFSATFKGTKANVDPTVVIREDPALNTGVVRKGSGNAIFSRGGASYLEIGGNAVQASMEVIREAVRGVLERAQCVILDPTQGAQESGESQKVRYMPMLAKCDLLREQYGRAIAQITRDMMRATRLLAGAAPRAAEDGSLIQTVVRLPPKVIVDVDDDGKEMARAVPRPLGASEEVELNWGPYFPATWNDIQAGITAARLAVGDKPVASLDTAVKLVSSMTGVRDVAAEIRRIEEDAEVAVDRAQRAFALPGDKGPGVAAEPEREERDEESEGESAEG